MKTKWLWLWLLAVPWSVVWVSSSTSNRILMLDGTTLADYPICPVLNNELCPGSYIPNFKKHEIVCHEGEDGCQDFVDALNAAHERRTNPPRQIQTFEGTLPCCEDKHQGVMCIQCDDHIQPQ